MPSKHKRSYPQRKRLKYKKDCPWEVEETPMDPEVYAKLSPWAKALVDQKPIPIPPLDPKAQRKDRPGIIHLAALIVCCLALSGVYKMVTAMGPGDGWIGLTFGILFCGFLTCVSVGGIFSILKEFMKEDSDDPPSLPVPDAEQKQQHEACQQVSEKERIRAYKFQLEKEKHQRILKEMREDEIGWREEYRKWEEEGAWMPGEEEEEQNRILEEQQEPIEDWMLQDDYQDPDNEHDPSVDYGPADDITEEEESRGWDYSGH